MEYKLHPERRLRHWASFPFIWAMAIPLVVFDVGIEIYHHICFPLYGIPKVKRREYIKLDRQRLSYLKWYDKINCAYCSYANGMMAYGGRIAGETERYWCGIKQDTKGYPDFHEPEHHKEFAPYGDEKAYEKKYCKLEKDNKNKKN